MTIDKDLIDRLRSRGEEMLTQVSAELMQNPRFMKAMEGAMKGKERVDDVVRQALKKANIPSRSEFKRAVARIESLEEELADLKTKAAATPAPPKAARKTSRKKTAKKTAKKTTRKAAKKKAR
jgi:polyhydroxyalkanoate synthesis regulator phasin